MRSQAFVFVILGALFILLIGPTPEAESQGGSVDFTTYEWTEVNPGARWAPRAGLQVVTLNNTFYLMGGRTPRQPTFPPIPGDSDIWGDVWESTDRGQSWTQILDTEAPGHWPARAYFQAVTKGSQMYVLGGQNFKAGVECEVGVPICSDFFNDVWRSNDGVNWTEMTDNAGWEVRAGLSSVVFHNEIYVMGGSKNDDESIGGMDRIYFDDVWKSRDGENWEQVTEHAPWEARAGAVTLAKNGYIYLLGGENGFLCAPAPCEPPYFNDVWRTRDGANWELVTAAAEWQARPGHQCEVLLNRMVCFGGFGLSQDPSDPFGAANPMDVWVSRNGASWTQVSDSPWNAISPEEIKYDFAALAAQGGPGGGRPTIFTFGGDRETFDFTDPTNYLNVDNDVWIFSAPE